MARLPLFEIARVLVRFDHVASFIVNADHRIIDPSFARVRARVASL
jgi:hypothetical protein